jgi:hypothetical protein
MAFKFTYLYIRFSFQYVGKAKCKIPQAKATQMVPCRSLVTFANVNYSLLDVKLEMSKEKQENEDI